MSVKQDFQKSQQMPQKGGLPTVQSGTTVAGGIYQYDSQKWNNFAFISVGLSAISFVLSLCFSGYSFLMIPVVILAAIFAGLSFKQIKEKRHKGRELVIASALLIVMSAVVIFATSLLPSFLIRTRPPIRPTNDSSFTY